MSLEKKLQEFKEKIITLAMPGFTEYSKKVPNPMNVGTTSAHDELVILGTEIKRAAYQDNGENFEYYIEHYNKIFKLINEDMAVQMYNEKVNLLLEVGLPMRESELGALQDLRQDKRIGRKFLHWFPQKLYARITMSEDITGYARHGTYNG